ncbi:MAG TPA: DNA-binding response regulator [Elusimicrobia bacterium]|nr:DNA-binding response regulator [Elusimicrobiota bacterium]HBT60697.1 DNA-binding response regulator [Elusimicrobiota bacterium]
MPKVLIVEDDPLIIEAVEKSLTLVAGYSLRSVSQPGQALPAAIRHRPDLILLDIRLPGGDGRAVLKALKENAATRGIPVIFLTGLSSEGDKVVGLNLGADDYVVKPFGAMELMARIQSVLRRCQPGSPARGVIKIAGLSLDWDNRSATLQGEVLKLQPKEFEVLYLLASRPGRALSRSYLVENTSTYGLDVATRSLDTHIKNIRKKLGSKADLIETVPKLGYRFLSADV